MYDLQVTDVLHQIVGAARARFIDTKQRARDYRADILGGRSEDYQQIIRLLERLTDDQKDQLWQLLQRDMLEQSNWKVYEVRFLMKIFGAKQLTIYADDHSGPPTVPTVDDDAQMIELGEPYEW